MADLLLRTTLLIKPTQQGFNADTNMFAKIFGYLAFKYIVFVSFIILTLYLSFIIIKQTIPSMITIY